MRRIRELIQQARSLWPSIVRAFRLVWEAAPGWTALWLVLLVAQGLLPVATVYLTKFLVDSLVALIENGLSPELLQPALLAIIGMLAVMLISEVLRSFTSMVSTAQTLLVKDHVRDLIHAKSVDVDFALFDSPDYFDLLFRASNDTVVRPLSLVEAFGSLLQNTITLFSMAVILLQYGLILPLALITSIIPAVAVVLHNRATMHKWHMKTTSDERLSWYYESILTRRQSAPEIRLFDLGDYFQQAYRVIRGRLRQQNLEINRRQSLFELLAGIFGLAILGIALGWILVQVVAGSLTLGDLALFYQSFNIGLGLMRSLLSNVGAIYANTLFLEQLFKFLDLQPQVVDPVNPLPVPTNLQEPINFEHVGFRYPSGERALLDDFNMTLEAGEFVAIMGKNGAGKSTLLKLLTRLYDVDSGRITIEGTDIRQYSLADLRRVFAVLFQDPVEYSETASQNIALGDLDRADLDAIIAAAEAAGADEMIAGLPRQYETLLGAWFSGGTDLSVGEWQRLSLARAFMRQSPVIILDEPTSAMDPWAEAEWIARLRESAAGKTVMIITHRLSTARFADTIYVMDNGRIVQSGTHDELLQEDGLYAMSWYATARPDEPKPLPLGQD